MRMKTIDQMGCKITGVKCMGETNVVCCIRLTSAYSKHVVLRELLNSQHFSNLVRRNRPLVRVVVLDLY